MHEYIRRNLEGALKQNIEWYPIVSVTGPRQSGKSTMLKKILPEYEYLNLEVPQLKIEAQEDPVGFISRRADKLIIDEAQNAPDLFSMIQVLSDERGTSGQYILSGSQNFLMMKNMQQTLAGRVGLLKLLPFSYSEISDQEDISVDEFILRGSYPRLYNAKFTDRNYFINYLDTYITRDVEGLLDIRNSIDFRRLLMLCANQVGSLLNYSSLSKALGVSAKTVKEWINILVQSYILISLPSYSLNVRKRVIKAPKLYFWDTGLLCHLLGIETVEELRLHEHYGAIYEDLIISERMKYHFNKGEAAPLYYYRDDSKREIDLLDGISPSKLKAFEIKSSQTYRDKFARHLVSVGEELGVKEENRFVVMQALNSFNPKEAKVLSTEDFLYDRL